MMDKRLNDKGKNWRHVFKVSRRVTIALTSGSDSPRLLSTRWLGESCDLFQGQHIRCQVGHSPRRPGIAYISRTLKEFVYVDETGKDVGANVRQKAKDITNLLMDEDRLRAERRSRGAMRDRMLGNLAESGLRGEEDFGESSREAPRAR